MAAEVERFQTAYLFRAHEIYVDARHTANVNSLEKARRLEALPSNRDLHQLNRFINSELEATKGKVEDALDGVWLPKEQTEQVVHEAEKFLSGRFCLAYLTGKGKKFVPVLIPTNLLEPIRELVAARASHGIPPSNMFAFATRHSDSHCLGWHAVQEICHLAQIKMITATSMRHKVSTTYAALDMTPADQKIFLDHMGHEASVNHDNYQCPVAVQEVNVMGKLLSTISGDVENMTVECQEQGNSLDEGSSTPISVLKNNIIISQQNPSVFTAASSPSRKRVFESGEDERAYKKKTQKPVQSKQEILEFLKSNNITSISHLDSQAQYLKIRAKIFNERKERRRKMEIRIQAFRVWSSFF
ncbi:hypothetical protein CAPTEDRAFT_203826 [Capitella teleta]|uniref:Uncharacterized protein n=1 Tax=Capitella teleta TaxID=283909 RepID=R7T8P3_CAPTE|nr:hypothetical protein CAPTEDRAFT_203826 [Capitella teleta]|eukprot:ELT89778.1 hypothetical protein CAPTEDRAFT_203826 [Capitella teleta]